MSAAAGGEDLARSRCRTCLGFGARPGSGQKCPECGLGDDPHPGAARTARALCRHCDGMGWVRVADQDADGEPYDTDEPCPSCDGSGTVIPCRGCHAKTEKEAEAATPVAE